MLVLQAGDAEIIDLISCIGTATLPLARLRFCLPVVPSRNPVQRFDVDSF